MLSTLFSLFGNVVSLSCLIHNLKEARWPHGSVLDPRASGPASGQSLAGDIVLYSWARHFTLTLPLSTYSAVGV